MANFDRITFDPQVMGGRACLRGMRITVSVIVSQIAHGATTEDILEGYPDLESEDIQQALEYGAWLAQEDIPNATKKDDWLSVVAGSFKDDPEFAEMVRLGREMRQADTLTG